MYTSEIPGLITVRTSSTRLPSKCLLDFGDCNVLTHVIRRAKHFGLWPIICTSTDSTDDVIEEIARGEKVDCFRGHLVNKLKRWSDCAQYFGLEYFHTVDADDPFFDADEMKDSVELIRSQKFDVVAPTTASASGGASVGYSLLAEVVERATALFPLESDTEMMWYFLKKVPGIRFTELDDRDPHGLPMRLTLDYPEDYWLLDSIRRIVGNFASRQQIVSLFRKNPDLFKINWFRNDEFQANQLAKAF